jgi:hypothetical protein
MKTWPDWAIHLKHRLLNWACEGQIEWLEAQIRNQEVILGDQRRDLISLQKLMEFDVQKINDLVKKIEEYEKLPIFRPEKVFYDRDGSYYVGDFKLTPQQLAILKQEAGYIKRTEIWTMFENTIGEMARQTMFERSTNFDDMKTGKAMLLNLSVLQKIVEKISK